MYGKLLLRTTRLDKRKSNPLGGLTRLHRRNNTNKTTITSQDIGRPGLVLPGGGTKGFFITFAFF